MWKCTGENEKINGTVDFIKARVYNQKIKLSRLMKTIDFAVSEHNSRVYSLIFL